MKRPLLAPALLPLALLVSACAARGGKPSDDSAGPFYNWANRVDRCDCEKDDGRCYLPSEVDNELMSRCVRAGKKIVFCCRKVLCTGLPIPPPPVLLYDARGVAKECVDSSCRECLHEAMPPGFEDACVAKGYEIKPCSHEWLCTGKVW